MIDLEMGDHITVDRQGYKHHGIYIGNGNVVHWTGDVQKKLYKQEEPVIEMATLDVFSRGDEVTVVKYREEIAVLPPESVVKRAMGRIGETGYNIIGNNCEHFAIWCKTGVHASTQVNDAVQWIGGLIHGIISRDKT